MMFLRSKTRAVTRIHWPPKKKEKKKKHTQHNDRTQLSSRLPIQLVRAMENYHRRPKTAKPKFDDNTADNANPNHHNRPQQHGVLVISPNGKIRTYVSRALEVLTEADTPPPTEQTESSKENQVRTGQR